MKQLLLIIALLITSGITASCTYGLSFNEEVLKPEKPTYVSIKETVFFRKYLAITPEQKFQLIKTKSNKTFVAKLDGQLNYGVNENLCLDGSHLSIGPPFNEYHSIKDSEYAEKRIQKLFGIIPCFSIVE
ncbi:Twin-arginine translocation pathway signal protein [Candidatus Micropelagos thuwalensis]|uniref:Twin-arginine translocation pathway signal protein n=1 Tax=Candidatus Micropelagius thuwalensis TaxID=1397666 RepID=U2WTT2_9PROT|nr:hypothetical protein [Candidatus Micropelagos thuwalensis]ERL46938.1 Twin-arginine translocation pathway signal protein [Candidatus Micropelagos thuwalensis]